MALLFPKKRIFCLVFGWGLRRICVSKHILKANLGLRNLGTSFLSYPRRFTLQIENKKVERARG
jgi:hypothetical protein